MNDAERNIHLDHQRRPRGCQVSCICIVEMIWNSNASFRDNKSPIIIQVSQGGAAYFAGKGLANDKQQASIVGAASAAHHTRLMAKAYGV
jgi:fructose/tagatose bisphosphate aldolase